MSNLQQRLKIVPAALLVLTIAFNIAWPIASGHTRTVLTILGVLSFFAESTIHAFVYRGTKFVLTFLFAVLSLSFLAEVIGVHTGLPFGNYSYAPTLGWQLWQVPLLIPLAWFMMMYPCWLIAIRLTVSRIWQIAIASWLMATWDLFLDPQMVTEGFWTWHGYASRESNDIPLSNFFGWLMTAVIVFAVLSAVLPKNSSLDFELAKPEVRNLDLVPFLAVAWVWLGSFIANIGWFKPFLDQPDTAISGLVGMGIVLVPFYWRLVRQLRVSYS